MSSPKVTPFNIGKTLGAVYDYAKAGDTLAMHNHGAADSHTIIVCRGRVNVRIQQPDGSIIETPYEGAFLDTQPGFPHEIVALTDNARTIHHQKG